MTEFKDLDDLAALKKINADWGRENTDRIRKRDEEARLKKLEETEEQRLLEEEAQGEALMGRIFELAKEFKVGQPIRFEYGGKKYILNITDYRSGSMRGSGYETRDQARIFITDSGSKKFIHELALNRGHDENHWYAGYVENTYSSLPAGGQSRSYKWRRLKDEENNSRFLAKHVSQQLPELQEIEEMLKAALKQDWLID